MTSFVRSIGFTMTVAGMLVIGVGAAFVICLAAWHAGGRLMPAFRRRPL